MNLTVTDIGIIALLMAIVAGSVTAVMSRNAPAGQGAYSLLARIDVLEKKVARLEAEKIALQRELDEHKRQLTEARAAQAALIRALSGGDTSRTTVSESPTFSIAEAAAFRRWVVRYFGRDDLALLADDVGAGGENIDAPTIETMAQNLITWADRRASAAELRAAARRHRPSVPGWDSAEAPNDPNA